MCLYIVYHRICIAFSVYKMVHVFLHQIQHIQKIPRFDEQLC